MPKRVTAPPNPALSLPKRGGEVDAETAVAPIRIQGLAGIVTDIAGVV
jgi:hypothetical protein